MTDQMKPGRHPFLEDLAADVVLITNVLKRPVTGRDKVLRIVKAGGAIYSSQKPTYLKKFDDKRSLFEYDADLVGGRTVHGVVVIDWNDDGTVSHLNIGFSPLTGALSFAVKLGEQLEGDFEEGLFL